MIESIGMDTPMPVAFFTSPVAWIVIGVVALLLFGRRVPSIARGFGQGIHEFRKGLRSGAPADESGERHSSATRDTGRQSLSGDAKRPD